jgi:hypothetical protein
MPTTGANLERINLRSVPRCQPFSAGLRSVPRCQPFGFWRRSLRRVFGPAVAACALLAAVQPTWAADPGDAGALFLRIGMGARASAMGEGYVAVAEDASSVYWNPAAMAAVLGTNLQFTHDEYFLSVRVEQLALTHETRYGTVGLSFTGMYMDDLERRGNTPGDPEEKFSVYDASFAFGFARYILPNFSLGATVKPVYQKIDERNASGWAFDFGIFHVARIDGLKLAAVIGNVGKPMKFISEEYALPRYIKVGGSYERDSAAARGRFLFTLDGVFPNDGDPKQNLGAEYMYRRTLALRAGYKAGYDSQGATFGLGLRYKKLDVDYAMMLVRNDLGDSHRFSLGLRL